MVHGRVDAGRTTGAYRAVEVHKKNIKIDLHRAASIEKSKEVVKICTKYAQRACSTSSS